MGYQTYQEPSTIQSVGSVGSKGLDDIVNWGMM